MFFFYYAMFLISVCWKVDRWNDAKCEKVFLQAHTSNKRANYFGMQAKFSSSNNSRTLKNTKSVFFTVYLIFVFILKDLKTIKSIYTLLLYIVVTIKKTFYRCRKWACNKNQAIKCKNVLRCYKKKGAEECNWSSNMFGRYLWWKLYKRWEKKEREMDIYWFGWIFYLPGEILRLFELFSIRLTKFE